MYYTCWQATGKLLASYWQATGKAVLIPLLTGECDYGKPEVKNDEDLRRCAMAGNDYGTIDAVVDGIKIKNLDKYRT